MNCLSGMAIAVTLPIIPAMNPAGPDRRKFLGLMRVVVSEALCTGSSCGSMMSISPAGLAFASVNGNGSEPPRLRLL